MISKLMQVIDDLIPTKNKSLSVASNLPLTNNNMRFNLPESILGIFNKLYTHRFELEKQGQQVGANREIFEKKLAKFDAKLSLLKKMNKESWQDALDGTPFGGRKEELQ